MPGEFYSYSVDDTIKEENTPMNETCSNTTWAMGNNRRESLGAQGEESLGRSGAEVGCETVITDISECHVFSPEN